MKIYTNIFDKIVSVENLYAAWKDFRKDKKNKRDVIVFSRNLEANISKLHKDLILRQYKHGQYRAFFIHDPKQRKIHKATVRDRILHHAVFNILNPIFESTFIADSFSCRIGKGTHKAVDRLEKMCRRVSRNNTQNCFVLKCDIRKFFATVDHNKLLEIIERRVEDRDAMALIVEIVKSFSSQRSDLFRYGGLPIGNLTSQLFANIYMNELDQFIKHKSKVQYYVRYTDDFVIVHQDPTYLGEMLVKIKQFLDKNLFLQIHPNKVSIRKFRQGVDFLGYVILPNHRVLRTKTRRRILRKIAMKADEYASKTITGQTFEQSLQSYFGVLKHANTHKLRLLIYGILHNRLQCDLFCDNIKCLPKGSAERSGFSVIDNLASEVCDVKARREPKRDAVCASRA